MKKITIRVNQEGDSADMYVNDKFICLSSSEGFVLGCANNLFDALEEQGFHVEIQFRKHSDPEKKT